MAVATSAAPRVSPAGPRRARRDRIAGPAGRRPASPDAPEGRIRRRLRARERATGRPVPATAAAAAHRSGRPHARPPVALPALPGGLLAGHAPITPPQGRGAATATDAASGAAPAGGTNPPAATRGAARAPAGRSGRRPAAGP